MQPQLSLSRESSQASKSSQDTDFISITPHLIQVEQIFYLDLTGGWLMAAGAFAFLRNACKTTISQQLQAT
jgi:hypothetical protein